MQPKIGQQVIVKSTLAQGELVGFQKLWGKEFYSVKFLVRGVECYCAVIASDVLPVTGWRQLPRIGEATTLTLRDNVEWVEVLGKDAESGAYLVGGLTSGQRYVVNTK